MTNWGRTAVIVALLTPWAGDDSLDLGALKRHVAFLVNAGVDGLMVCGTTGEGPLLTDAETESVVATAVETVNGRIPVIAHVGRPSTTATQRLARRVVGLGCAAVSAVVPYYYPLTDFQIAGHFRRLIEATRPTPLFAYTIPSRAGNELTPVVAELLAEDGLAGIKDSTKSLETHLEFLAVAERHDDFLVFIGSDGLVLPAFRQGASGVVSALANSRPDLLLALKAAVANDDEALAEALQAEIGRLRKAHGSKPPLVGLKQSTANLLREQGLEYTARWRGPLGC